MKYIDPVLLTQSQSEVFSPRSETLFSSRSISFSDMKKFVSVLDISVYNYCYTVIVSEGVWKLRKVSKSCAAF